jgi:NAD(P)H-dependent FMN reductase
MNKNMITVISGTNRKGSECLTFAKKYVEILESLTSTTVKLLAMEDIPHDWYSPEMYEKDKQAPSLIALQDEYIVPATKFVYVISEYNGGFPGAVKIFLDACSVRQIKPSFKNKKAALVGVATGRAGNLRGMDHLAAVLNHLGTIVMPNKLPISKIYALMDGDRNITDKSTIELMTKQAEELLAF